MPLVSHYMNALSTTPLPLKRMRGCELARNEDGAIYRFFGSRGAVVKCLCDGESYAIKVFTNPNNDLLKRYQLLKELNFDFVPEVDILDDEITILEFGEANTYPVIRYTWIEGDNLEKRVKHLCRIHDKEQLAILCDDIINLFIKILSSEIVHGDIKPENILCREDGKIYLLDWDCFYHESIKEGQIIELGSEGYRRKSRTMKDYGRRLDDYPMAVIVMGLVALAYNPLYFNINKGIDELYYLFTYPKTVKIIRDSYLYMPKYKALIDYILSEDLEYSELLNIFMAISGKVPFNPETHNMIDNNGIIRRVIDLNSKLYGYMDIDSGLITITATYGDATIFSDEMAAVKINSDWFFIDRKGRRISDNLYSVVEKNDGSFMVKTIATCEYVRVVNINDLGKINR